MKTTLTIIIIAIIGLGFFLVIGGIGAYNSLVSSREAVKTEWGNVETAYQRRADLIPNLVSTVKGAANFEQETLIAVIEARAKATSVNIDAGNLTAESFAAFNAAQQGLSSSLSKLLVSVEKYPELKAVQNFSALQSQLEGTENRIAVARQDYNGIAQPYNTSRLKLPHSIIANMFGFEAMPYFNADEGAKNAPQVQF
jgi:LemA protein